MIELKQQTDHDKLRLLLQGDWEQSAAVGIHQLLDKVSLQGIRSICFDASESTRLDISAVWLVYKQAKAWEADNIKVCFEHFPEEYFIYFDAKYLATPRPSGQQFRSKLKSYIWEIGSKLYTIYKDVLSVITFLGHSLSVFSQGFRHPRQLRVPTIFQHVFITGISALPIIALLAALISIVFTYQGGSELRDLGATIYTVDLVSASILRELGVLLTAIMVAGRSSSAFAAEIGIMKSNQEIDALKVSGLNPYEILVVPRMVALVLALPLLTLMADLLALAGAALISNWSLGITFNQFIERLQQNIELHTFMAGIIKAPFFAVVIAIIGTWNGMQVTGSAESLGHHTTAAVVQSIFMVLFLDAIFSMFYYNIGF